MCICYIDVNSIQSSRGEPSPAMNPNQRPGGCKGVKNKILPIDFWLTIMTTVCKAVIKANNSHIRPKTFILRRVIIWRFLVCLLHNLIKKYFIVLFQFCCILWKKVEQTKTYLMAFLCISSVGKVVALYSRFDVIVSCCFFPMYYVCYIGPTCVTLYIFTHNFWLKYHKFIKEKIETVQS